jgi:ubiquinone/menaquinone biosynthesis C-methylase UbiE
MTWEEIIIQIRKDPSYKNLVEKAYFEEDLQLNVERFRKSEEFFETMIELKRFFNAISGKKLLDLGAGNGIASLSFALNGIDVFAAEPDKSETIGNGAIRLLEEKYKTGRVNVVDAFGEKLPFENNFFDIVYIRQAMHHAHKLDEFVKECARVLRTGGLLITVRDHIVYNEPDKKWFLESHPLHKFYGGENAFTFDEYSSAIKNAGLKIIKYYQHYESVINYFPEPKSAVETKLKQREDLIKTSLSKKVTPVLANLSFLKKMYSKRIENKLGKVLDETKIPGRNISFFALKQN